MGQIYTNDEGKLIQPRALHSSRGRPSGGPRDMKVGDPLWVLGFMQENIQI